MCEQLILNAHDSIQREVTQMTEEKLNEYKHVTQEFTNLKAQQTYNELQEKIYQIEKDAAFPKD